MSSGEGDEGFRLEELDFAAPDWGAVAARSDNFFGTPDWLSLWWEHYGKGRRLELRAVRADDGRLAAILPLYIWKDGRIRVARFLGHGPGDELGPVCAPGDRPLAAAALRQALADLGADALLAERLPGAGGWQELLHARAVHHEASPTLEIEGRSWDEYLRSQSRNFRDQARRYRKKLAREHAVSTRLADDPAKIDDDIATLFALHREQWPEGTSDFTGADEPFQRAFLRRSFERGWLRLLLLDVDGATVAADYAIRFGDVDADYQGGRSAAWDHANVGWILQIESVQHAFDAGRREYRFLRGDEPYKYRLATRDDGVTDIAVPCSLTGRAFALTARHRSSPALRAVQRLRR